MSGITKLFNSGITPGVVFVTSDGSSSGFSSISAAVASLVGTADATHPYAVLVRSGIYTEPVITVPSYVSIRGDGINSTIVQPDGNHDVFVMSNMTEVAFLTIDAVAAHTPGGGKAGLLFEDVGDFAQAHKVSIYNCDIGVDCDNSSATTTAANVHLEYVDINGDYTYGLEIDTYIDMSIDKYHGTTTGMGTLQWTVTEAAISTANDTINIPGHGRYTGGKLLYTAANPAIPIGGLTTNTSYYVIRINADFIKLALTYNDAQAGTEINLTQPAASSHTFDLQAAQFVEDLDRMGSTNWTFLGSNVAANEITVTHSRTTGDRTLYTAETTEITGLVTGTYYYIINTGANKVKLASTHALALAGTALPISDPGGVTNHRLGVKEWVVDELADKHVMLRGGISFGQDRLIDHNTATRISFLLPITQFPVDDGNCGYYIGYPMFCNAENTYFYPELANTGSDVLVSGGGAILSWSTGEIKGSTDSDGITLNEGAEVRLQSIKISGSQHGINVLNTGSSGAQNAPVLDVLNAWIDFCSAKAILIDNPKTGGQISGDIEPHDIEFDSGVTNMSVLVQSETPAGINLVGDQYAGKTLDQLTDTSTQLSQGANMGAISKVNITINDNLGTPTDGDISIDAGLGYLMKGTYPNGYLWRVDWVAQAITIHDIDAMSFVYIDNAGVLQTSLARPDTSKTVFLGRVYCYHDGAAHKILFWSRSYKVATQTASKIDDTLRLAFGSIYQSGSIASIYSGTITSVITSPDTAGIARFNCTGHGLLVGDIINMTTTIVGYNGRITIDTIGTGWYETAIVFSANATGTFVAEETINVPSGSYYFSNWNFTPSGGSDNLGLVNPIMMDIFYKDAGTWIVTTAQHKVDVTPFKWNDLAGPPALVNLVGTEHVRHALYVSGGQNVDGTFYKEKYFLVIGQVKYVDLVSARAGGIPTVPSGWSTSTALVSSIICDDSKIVEVRDERPTLAFKASGITGITTHGDLSGLNVASDHPQYLYVNGGNEMTGDLDMGANDIVFHTPGTGIVDGVTVSAHASRHLPNSITDALSVGVPSAIAAANAEGGANAFARQDHIHKHPVFAAGGLHTDYLHLDGVEPMTEPVPMNPYVNDTFLPVGAPAGRTLSTVDAISVLDEDGKSITLTHALSSVFPVLWDGTQYIPIATCDGPHFYGKCRLWNKDVYVLPDSADHIGEIWCDRLNNKFRGTLQTTGAHKVFYNDNFAMEDYMTNEGTAYYSTVATNVAGGELGSIIYQDDLDVTLPLAPNITMTKKYLTMTGTGAIGATPAWDTIIAGDIPTLNQSTTGSAGSLKSVATTGLMTVTGMAALSTRAKTVRDADDTILELGGSYTPTGTWVWTSATATWPTFNQSTSGTASIATNTTITEDVATAVAVYPTWVTANNGNLPQKTTSTRLSFVPSTGILTATGFSGPLSGNVTGNVTGSSGSCTGTAAVATDTTITNDAATAVAVYPTWVTANNGNLPQKTTSTKLSFVPSTGVLTATGFSGPLSGNVTGNVTGDVSGSSGSCTGTSLVATNTTITNDVATAVAVYPTWVTANAGNLPQRVSSTKLSFVPSTGTLTSSFISAGVLTSTVAIGTAPFTVTSTTVVPNLKAATCGTADNVTTNANLTGMVTSVGNATTVVTNANLVGAVTSVGNTTSITYGEVSNTDTINHAGTATTLNEVTTMVTPALAAGTYLVSFSCWSKHGSNNETITFQLFNNTTNTPVVHSLRTWSPSSGGNDRECVHTQAVMTVALNDTIDVRWATSANTASCSDRSMNWIRLA